jgi:hypothetical protein
VHVIAHRDRHRRQADPRAIAMDRRALPRWAPARTCARRDRLVERDACGAHAHRLARFERAQGHGHIVARGDLQGIGQGGASVSGASVMPV